MSNTNTMKHGTIIAVAALSLLTALPITQVAANSIITKQMVSPHKATAKATAVLKPTPTGVPKIVSATPAPTATLVPKPVVVATPAPTYVPRVILANIHCSVYAGLFRQYAWNTTTAMAICQAESGGDPNSISPPDTDGLRDYGLMQIHGEPIFDPAANVARAYGKYITQGWHAWSTYTSGKYLQYLQ